MFSSDNKSMLFYYNSVCFGQAKLIDGYWFVDCDNACVISNQNQEVFMLNNSLVVKRKFSHDSSSYLWHKRLGHISKERMKSLIK